MNDSLIGLPSETFNSVTNYLMSRPYKEVHNLIAELKEVAQIISIESKEEETSDDD